MAGATLRTIMEITRSNRSVTRYAMHQPQAQCVDQAKTILAKTQPVAGARVVSVKVFDRKSLKVHYEASK